MEKTIDIEKILTSKLGGKARLVPRCLINWLRKIAHEDQVNQFLYDHRDEVGTQWLTSTVEYLKMHITIEGEENLPSKDDGKLYTFVSNHPLGGQDGVALGSIIGRHYDGRFRYLVNDLLMNLPAFVRSVWASTRRASRAATSHAWSRRPFRATTISSCFPPDSTRG